MIDGLLLRWMTAQKGNGCARLSLFKSEFLNISHVQFCVLTITVLCVELHDFCHSGQVVI